MILNMSHWRNDLFLPKTSSLLLLSLLCVLLVTMETKELGEDTPIRPEEMAWLDSLFYLPEEPRVRLEYRMLTAEERLDLNDAFVMLKNDTSVKPNKFDLLTSLHSRRSTRNSAHRGPGFLGWHRVYTLLMENALREKVPNITIPYWDCTLDSYLPLARESSLWSADFMGNGDGQVSQGHFSVWETQQGQLYRTVGISDKPLTEANITRLFNHSHIGDISYPQGGNKADHDILELTHNAVHRFIGGTMKIIETAAEDPVFYIFHSFTNYVWEKFRRHQRSKGIDPELDWDLYYGKARHHKYSPMGLGNLFAIDCSSEIFAENIVYAARPSCSNSDPDCKTPYLYCNLTIERCLPWTIQEYSNIKTSAASKNVSFIEEAGLHIIQKIISQYKDINANETEPDDTLESYEDGSEDENHEHNEEEEMEEGEEYEKSENDHDDEHDEEVEHTHENEDHSHEETVQEIPIHDHTGHDHHKSGMKSEDEGNWYVYLTAIVLGVAVLIHTLFCVVSRFTTSCVSCERRKTRSLDLDRKENGRKRTDNEIEMPPQRCVENIYTVTVTSDGDQGDSMFVRFARYNKPEGLNVEDYKLDRQARSNASDNYLDMDYATKSNAVHQSEDLFEHVTDLDEELETSYNSIDNENFDLAGITAAYYNSANDVVQDYDNVVFRKEAELQYKSQNQAVAHSTHM